MRQINGAIEGDRWVQPPTPFPMSSLWKTQWKSVQKFMTKKQTLATIATTIAAMKDAL